jgi:hypothetical protein
MNGESMMQQEMKGKATFIIGLGDPDFGERIGSTYTWMGYSGGIIEQIEVIGIGSESMLKVTISFKDAKTITQFIEKLDAVYKKEQNA